MKKILAFAMAAVLMLGLAACGGSGASAPASSAAGSASASSRASGPRAQQAGRPLVEEIQEKGVLTVMTATGFPPFEYLGEDGKAGRCGHRPGAVGEPMGWAWSWKCWIWTSNLLIGSLKSGRGSSLQPGMTATSERARSKLISPLLIH